MEQAFLHRVARVLWRTLVSLIVLLAVYVSFGRLAVSALGDYQAQILAYINARVPFQVSARQVAGDWRFFSPELVLTDLELQLPDQDRVLELAEGRVRLDVLGSLLARNLQASHVTLDTASLNLVLGADGSLSIAGLDSGGGSEFGNWGREFILNLKQFKLAGHHFQVLLPNGDQRDLDLDVQLQRDGSYRVFSGRAITRETGTEIALEASALGNVFEPQQVDADIYFQVQGANLAALLDWLPSERLSLPVAAEGEVDLDLWLHWRAGHPDYEARVRSRNLLLAASDGEWRYDLEQLDFDANLALDEHRLSLFVDHLLAKRGTVSAALPRLQIEREGEALLVRGTNLPLQPVGVLAADFPELSPAVAEVLKTLQPAGDVGPFELHIENLQAPADDWGLKARFVDLGVDVWRGAPGLRAGRGYVELAPGKGQVILDSKNISLDFASVYDHPLVFNDLYGSFDLHWDAETFGLRSGLINAVGDEGPSHSLLALDIPLVDIEAGPEMELLIGLQESSAAYRDKLLPVVLNAQLYQWLQTSLVSGDIAQGAFLWRGSLSGDSPDLRTVQLFFHLNQTEVAFHPQWPPVQDVRGTVLVDDTNVSVWADQAKLFNADIQWCSAEVWMDQEQHMRLALRGEMSGDASDGLKLVHESPLSKLTGDVFEHWQMQGEMQANVGLDLSLGGEDVPPRVDYLTHLKDVTLDVVPLDLNVGQLQGMVHYHSDHGFSSKGLQGRLWGEKLSAAISRDRTAKGSNAINALRLELATELPAADVQQWLGLADSPLATGKTPAEAELKVMPGATPTFSLSSSLQGLELTLPAPLDKPAAQVMPLSLALALEGEQRPLHVKLGPRIDSRLLLGENWQVLGGTAVLFGGLAEAPVASRLVIDGDLPQLDVAAWQRLSAALPQTQGSLLEQLPPVQINDLEIDTLTLDSMVLENIELSARTDVEGGLWLQAQTRWIQGALTLEPGFGSGSVAIERLLLDELPAFDTGDQSAQSDELKIESELGELPRLRVDIASIEKGGKTLGELHFELRSTPWDVRAAAISGRYAALEVPQDMPAELLWRRGVPGSTSVSARLNFSDLGKVLQELGYDHILETEDGYFDVTLDWPGAPQDFALLGTGGRIGIDIDSGRFLDIKASTSGTLRVVSILNLTEIIRRLSLSHMFESGVPFDDVKGEVMFHRGTIEVPSIVVQGAASSFTFSGVSPIAERTLSGELVATLPVASNLPWVAALTAGLPVAAGVFVVSKVFENQMNKASSAVYSIGGSWDDPKIKFSRIFDTGNSRSKKLEPSAGTPASGVGPKR